MKIKIKENKDMILSEEFSHLREKKPKKLTKPVTIRMSEDTKKLISLVSLLESKAEGEVVSDLLEKYVEDRHPELLKLIKEPKN